MTTPLVSVILPVYNGQDYLVDCIESILSQSFKNFEFVIVDDASTDSTPQILQRYTKIDNRITVITHETNKKQTIAANTACSNSKGKYIARMDADDIALSNRLAEQVKYLENHPDVGILGSWAHYIDDRGHLIAVYKAKISHQHLCWRLLYDPGFISSSVMMRRDIVAKLGFYQTVQAEDYDLWSRASSVSRVVNLPIVLQKRRVWGGQVYHTVEKETYDFTIQIMKKNMGRLLNNSLIDLNTVGAIRAAFKNTKPNLDKELILESISLIKKLYSSYISKTELTKIEKKSIKIDVYQMLNRLTTWLFSLDIRRAIFKTIYLIYRFPKLFLYGLYLRIKKNR